MARIPLLTIPTGHVPPSRRCEQCAVARQTATETAVRKRGKKQDAAERAPESESEPIDLEPTPVA